MDNVLFPLLNRAAANPVFDWLMPRITNLHHQRWFLACVALLIVGVAWKGSRQARVWLLCALLAVGASDGLATHVAKRYIKRDRPCHITRIAGQLGPAAMSFAGTRLMEGESCPGSPSMPSNHAANMAGLGGVCWWISRRRAQVARGSGSARSAWKPLLWLLLPLVIGYSRIYLGYHYPTDVLAGWALGGAVASLVILLVAKRLLPEPEDIPQSADGRASAAG